MIGWPGRDAVLARALEKLLFAFDGAVGASKIPKDLYDAATKNERLAEAFYFLTSNLWSLKWGSSATPNYEVDRVNKVVTFDETHGGSGPPAHVEEALRAVFWNDNSLRRAAVLKRAEVAFEDTSVTELEALAMVLDWSAWFWTGPADLMQGELSDMLVVFGDGTPADPQGPGHSPFYLWRGRRVVEQADSKGFKAAYRQAGNQIRHTAISLFTSYTFGKAGYLAAQAVETEPADLRLNLACYRISEALKAMGSADQISTVGGLVRQELGDPNETGNWSGPDAGNPPPPTPPLWGL